MFNTLQDRLDKALSILKGQHKITEINIAKTTKEIRRALVEADVNYKIAKTFTDSIKEKALGQGVLKSVQPGQMLVKIVEDELRDLMGGEAASFQIAGNPAIILIAGLQGSGKTTFAHKLAHWAKSKKGKSPLMVAGDVYRPAAIDQLASLGEKIDIPVFYDLSLIHI